MTGTAAAEWPLGTTTCRSLNLAVDILTAFGDSDSTLFHDYQYSDRDEKPAFSDGEFAQMVFDLRRLLALAEARREG